MLKGANRIQWRIRFLEMTEVSATDLHMSRKFQNFLASQFPEPDQRPTNKDLRAFLSYQPKHMRNWNFEKRLPFQ